ncbi:hypothetical protein CPB83DRAFT_864645 [Crepidotus variabilis]|uniref:Uncharacterized protein n=1 Tax=Crepidotus variabilis TaxID=179855 RepID=A0A9P6E4I3_9AGAR|nr:hypothetical protein CPB83DRAFT_864645 [Crepidotus variabilis]
MPVRLLRPQTMSTATTTTTMTTPSSRTRRTPVPLLLEAFPVPPSHIPPTPTNATSNPPPTGPPTLPLPPVPGPSRISEHEQLLLLSSVSTRPRRSSKYSVASSSQRESVISIGSTGREGSTSSARTSIASSSGGGKSPAMGISPLPPMSHSPARRDSNASSRSSPRSPSLGRPSMTLSVPSSSNAAASSGRHTPAISPITQLSDIEDEDIEENPKRMQSPALQASWRRSRHHHANESINSIDVRDILGVEFDADADGTDNNVDSKLRRSTTSQHPRHVTNDGQPSSPQSPTSDMLKNSFSYPTTSKHSPFNSISSTPNSETLTFVPKNTAVHSREHSRSISGPISQRFATPPAHDHGRALASSPESLSISADPAMATSPTVKDIRMEMRAERTKSAGLKKSLAVRSRSRSRVGERGEPPPAPDADLPPIPGAASAAIIGLGLDLDPKELGDAGLGPILVTKTTTLLVEQAKSARDEMTLDELGPAPEQRKKGLYEKPRAAPTPSRAKRPKSVVQAREDVRTPSPDIDSILSSTPRPALRKSTSRSRVRSQGVPRSRVDSSASNPAIRRRISEGVVAGRSATSWHGHGASSDLPYLQRASAWSSPGHRGEVEVEYDEEMERVLEGSGSDDEYSDGPRGREGKEKNNADSDSDIDLHTPLPHLMVRHGLLSPNSRLLPGTSRAVTPLDGRPGSMMSMASSLTKSGILKDERDTPTRRVRHRDNKLLRGGIGLTTGLGWSDSEDEDAPSPLTRRLSTLNLSHRSSSSSIASSATPRRHPLSRSYSSGALIESEHELQDINELDNSTEMNSSSRSRVAGRTSLPPTSWQTKSTGSKRSSNATRTSTSSIGSSLSLEIDGSRSRASSRIGKVGAGTRDSTGSSADQHGRSSSLRKTSPMHEVRTPSSGSTFSIPSPSTPSDFPSSTTPFGSKTPFDKEKSLPPLPSGGLRKAPSDGSNYGFPRARTFSSTSSASNPSVMSAPNSTVTSPVVRPLQLPRVAARNNGDRAAVPVPSVLNSSASQSSLRTPSRSPMLASATSSDNVPLSPISSTTGTPRPKPRTGTGMAYRTSSSSRMRAPMALASSTSSTPSSPSYMTVGSLGRVGGSAKVTPL